MAKYPKEKILQLYKSLPEELKDMLGAEETIDTLEELSNKYQLSDDQSAGLVNLVGEVMMGLLTPGEFQESLEALKIKKKDAAEINHTIYRFILYPVRRELNVLYETQMEMPKTADKTEAKTVKRKIETGKADRYREEVE